MRIFVNGKIKNQKLKNQRPKIEHMIENNCYFGKNVVR